MRDPWFWVLLEPAEGFPACQYRHSICLISNGGVPYCGANREAQESNTLFENSAEHCDSLNRSFKMRLTADPIAFQCGAIRILKRSGYTGVSWEHEVRSQVIFRQSLFDPTYVGDYLNV